MFAVISCAFTDISIIIDRQRAKVNDGLGLISVLSRDMPVKNPTVEIGDLQVCSHDNKFRGWTLKMVR